MFYLSLEDTEWPWVALVCMQTVVLMSVRIAPRQKIIDIRVNERDRKLPFRGWPSELLISLFIRM